MTVRVLRVPEAVRTLLAGFELTDAAGEAVSRTIAAGILPAAIEMMDALTIEAVEAAVGAGYPRRRRRGADRRARRAAPRRSRRTWPRSRRSAAGAGAFEIRLAADPDDRAAVWRGRKSAFAAMGRICPNYYVQDGVVPRTRLPEVLRRIDDALARARAARRQRLPRRRRQPAPARALRRARRGRGRARRAARRPRSSTSASTRAARSPASTASASTRRARCRRCSARTTSP